MSKLTPLKTAIILGSCAISQRLIKALEAERHIVITAEDLRVMKYPQRTIEYFRNFQAHVTYPHPLNQPKGKGWQIKQSGFAQAKRHKKPSQPP